MHVVYMLKTKVVITIKAQKLIYHVITTIMRADINNCFVPFTQAPKLMFSTLYLK